jgi:hypothetical protein
MEKVPYSVSTHSKIKFRTYQFAKMEKVPYSVSNHSKIKFRTYQFAKMENVPHSVSTHSNRTVPYLPFTLQTKSN